MSDPNTAVFVSIIIFLKVVLLIRWILVICNRVRRNGHDPRELQRLVVVVHHNHALEQQRVQRARMQEAQTRRAGDGGAQQQRYHLLDTQSPNLHLTPQPQEEVQQHPNQTPLLQQNQQDQQQQQQEEEEGGPEIPQHCWLNEEDMIIEKQGS